MSEPAKSKSRLEGRLDQLDLREQGRHAWRVFGQCLWVPASRFRVNRAMLHKTRAPETELRIRLIGILVVSLSHPPSRAAAAELPRYDPEHRCETIARRAGRDYLAQRHACIEREQASYDRLKAGEWETANARDQVRAIATVRPTDSYVSLEATLSALVGVRQDRERLDDLQTTNHFRRD